MFIEPYGKIDIPLDKLEAWISSDAFDAWWAPRTRVPMVLVRRPTYTGRFWRHGDVARRGPPGFMFHYKGFDWPGTKYYAPCPVPLSGLDSYLAAPATIAWLRAIGGYTATLELPGITGELIFFRGLLTS